MKTKKGTTVIGICDDRKEMCEILQKHIEKMKKQKRYINAYNVVLRGTPGTQGTKIGLLQYGERYRELNNSQNGWTNVQMISGGNTNRSGYVAYMYCTIYLTQ